MRVLIIEDEKKTCEFLRKGLTESGFVVDTAEDGETGLHLARDGAYDLLVLDVTLPRIEGWEVLRDLRRGGWQTPAIFLSARGTVSDRVKGLELGADDYLIKPFAFSELPARVRSLLRRGTSRAEDTLRVGDLEINVARHKAQRAGQPLDLAPKEFALLALLARRAGDVLSRAEISEQVWDMNFDSDTNVVEVAVGRLRRKVDDPFPTKLLHTVRGCGYRLGERA